MRLRCFFGPWHGTWIEVHTEPLKVSYPIDYRPIRIEGRECLVHQSKGAHQVLDWLFTYDSAHPQEPSDHNHPRQLARAGR